MNRFSPSSISALVSRPRVAPIVLFCGAACLLPACSAPPIAQKPVAPPAPTAWTETAAANPPAPLDAKWWKIFADPALDALESQALTANPNLAQAVARVDEVRALVGVASAERSVTVNLDGSASRARASATDDLPPFFPIYTTRLRGAVDASYEIDAWSRVKNNIAAARRDADVAVADEASVRLTLTGDVARIYYQMRAAEAEIDVLRRTLGLREDTLKIEQARVDAGLMNDLSVARARLEIATTHAGLESVERQHASLQHALAVLTGAPPAAAAGIAATPIPALPEVPVALPSEVLKRRPDVAAADLAVDAALARVNVARAAFFPQISLTGNFGLESARVENLLQASSHIAALAPSISVPLFEGGRNRAQYDAARARVQEVMAGYQTKVLSVLQEVEDALSDLKWLARQSQSIEDALAAAKDTAQLSRERYARGLDNYLDTVEAERSVLEAERTRAQLTGQRFAATIALAKAVGGGWEQKEARD